MTKHRYSPFFLSRLRVTPGRALRAAFCALLALGMACSPPEEPHTRAPVVRRAEGPVERLDLFRHVPIGRAPEPDERPWMTSVLAADLDQDGRVDVLATDALRGEVVWLRQDAAGHFEERVIAEDLPGPVRVSVADMDGDGHLDVLVACMSKVFPNNAHIGSIVVLINDGETGFTPRTILENVPRVTDVRAGDFNRDGRADLAVAQFGYNEGEVRWMENLGDWQFRSHILLSLPGAIDVLVADVTGNRNLDIITLVSQDHEEIYLFEGDGQGGFTQKVIFGSTNTDFGSSGIALCDLNQDGRPDILYTNGDGFDYAEPGSRPWHGVQWLENRGGGFFTYHRVADMPGAYGPSGGDFDGDGHMDILAVSGFNEWHLPKRASVMLFRNDGKMNFTPWVLAHEPTHLIATAVLERGFGRPDAFVTSAFHAYPPFDRTSRLLLWQPVVAEESE